MYYIDEQNKSINYKFNLLSDIKTINTGTRYNIGNDNQRWSNIYSNNVDSINLKSIHVKANSMDISTDISLGTSEENNPQISLSQENPNTIIFNGNSIFIDDKMNKLIDINNNIKRTIVNTDFQYNKFISASYDIIVIDKNRTILKPKKSLIILIVKKSGIIELEKPENCDNMEPKIKIVIGKNDNNIVEIKVKDNKTVKLDEKGSNVEYIYINNNEIKRYLEIK